MLRSPPTSPLHSGKCRGRSHLFRDVDEQARMIMIFVRSVPDIIIQVRSVNVLFVYRNNILIEQAAYTLSGKKDITERITGAGPLQLYADLFPVRVWHCHWILDNSVRNHLQALESFESFAIGECQRFGKVQRWLFFRFFLE